jgi:hypothetical protein
MRTDTARFRLTSGLCAAALLFGGIAAPARAQSSMPTEAGPAMADPPARVGRLARANGPVWFQAAGAAEWQPAAVNFPVAAGTALRIGPDTTMEADLGGSRIALAGGSELVIGALDGGGLQAELIQGEVFLGATGLGPSETWSLRTPHGVATVTADARIAVIAGSDTRPTVVSVLAGQVHLAGQGLDRVVQAGEAATLSGDTVTRIAIGPAAPDAFTQAEAGRFAAPLPAVMQPDGVGRLPGGTDLARYGSWSAVPDRGDVWFPAVAADWEPYRMGQWVFIPPWGWTWIDDAPWGFAPFHYGRWLQVGGRWGWLPSFGATGRGAYPAYAPALVGFVGLGAGVAVTEALRSHTARWRPLGPGEAYRPWSGASPHYPSQANRTALPVMAPTAMPHVERPVAPHAAAGFAPAHHAPAVSLPHIIAPRVHTAPPPQHSGVGQRTEHRFPERR